MILLQTCVTRNMHSNKNWTACVNLKTHQLNEAGNAVATSVLDLLGKVHLFQKGTSYKKKKVANREQPRVLSTFLTWFEPKNAVVHLCPGCPPGLAGGRRCTKTLYLRLLCPGAPCFQDWSPVLSGFSLLHPPPGWRQWPAAGAWKRGCLHFLVGDSALKHKTKK